MAGPVAPPAVGDGIAGVQGAATFLKGVAVPAAQRLIGLEGGEECANERMPDPGRDVGIALRDEQEGIETIV